MASEYLRTTLLVMTIYLLGGLAITTLAGNPVQAALANSFWWTLLFSLLAAGRIAVQMMPSSSVLLAPYPNRL